MIYECEIKGVDEEEVIIEIDGIEIVCFCNSGCNYSIGYHTTCELDLFGDLLIEESQEHVFLERKANTYSYNVVGVLDVENKLLRSCIDFSINESAIWDFSYLDNKMVRVMVSRINIDFVQ